MSSFAKYILFGVFSFYLATSCFGQNKYGHTQAGNACNGFIILKDGTKKLGIVYVKSLTRNEVKVTFKTNGGKKKTYKPSQLQAYQYSYKEKDQTNNWIHYSSYYEVKTVDRAPIPFSPKKVFLHREIKGDISLYSFYYEDRSDVQDPVKYEFYIETAAGFSKVKKDEFESLARKLFRDYPAMIKRLGTRGFRYNNLHRMVRDYQFFKLNNHSPDEYRIAPGNYYDGE